MFWSQLYRWWGPRHSRFPWASGEALEDTCLSHRRSVRGAWVWNPMLTPESWVACSAVLIRVHLCAWGGGSFFFNEQDVDSNLMILNIIILGLQIEKCHFFENGKYLAVKLVSETLCITKYLKHRSFVSFAARRDIQSHSEVETQRLSSRARTRTQAFGVPFSWSFWYATMPLSWLSFF